MVTAEDETDNNTSKTNTEKTKLDCSDVPVGCPKILAPVCASNGQTYESECIFKQLVCENNLDDLSIVRDRPCNEPLVPKEDDGVEEEDEQTHIEISNVESDDSIVGEA